MKKKENVKMSKKQYIGLDIGTDSVGWAVTDENYKVIKAKGKLLYGTRIFDSAKTAAERRAFRTGRRRTQRRKERVALLESIFSDPISKVDFEFFQRLKESAFYDGDKSVKGNFSLFNDANFTDRDYYNRYPTIYHLRKALIENDEKFDIRLVYLAVHHLIKYRGNFLMEGQELSNDNQDDSNFIVGLFKDIKNYYYDNDISLDFSLIEENSEKFVDTIIYGKGINKIKYALNQEYEVKDKISKEIFKLLSGGSSNISIFYPMLELDGIDPESIKFNKANFEDEILPSIISQLGNDSKVIENLYKIYTWLQFKKILNGSKYYSFAMVERFNEYKKDLTDLKNLYRKYFTKDEYNNMFRKEVKNNYSAYNRKSQYKNKKYNVKACSYDDFINNLKKELKKHEDILCRKQIDDQNNEILIKCEEYQTISERIDSGDFLRKIVTSDNGVLPYQLNELELRKILENQSKYYEFLNEKEGDLSVIDKIIKLLTFRIQYFVGPLNGFHNKEKGEGFSWVVRKQEGKVTPWNFDSMIDLDESENRFILTMTNKCTYLPTEDVLPKQSLLYQKFLVLNDLNNLKINNVKLTPELKQEIFEEVFCKNKNVTLNKVKKWIVQNNKYPSEEEIVFSGVDPDFRNYLTSYVQFSKIIGPFNMDKAEMVENIIRWMVISPDRTRIKKRINENYRDKLNKDQIDAISRLSFSGWGRLSRKLLDSQEISFFDTTEDVRYPIIDLLYSTNLNFNQLLYNPDFKMNDAIVKFNKEQSDDKRKITFEDVDNLPISPLVKRPVNQSLKIMEEIRRITKKNPDKVFVEVTRENDKKKKNKVTSSRKQELVNLYKKGNLEKECHDFNKLMEELNAKEVSRLRQDKLYLYFKQLGKDMYSGDPIDLDELNNNNKYDIDHIFPQSIIKDDSISNRVLVNKQSNARKTNVYPLDSTIINKMQGFWKMLYKKGMISKRKYERLTRRNPISEEEVNSFVSRQIVATNQATKSVINLLQMKYSKARIVWSKASHVSAFRRDYGFLKSREANDYHHAKDAYLNIVVGNVFDISYNQIMKEIARHKYVFSQDKQSISDFFKTHSASQKNKFNRDIPGIWSVQNGNRSIDIVKKYMSYNPVLFSVMPIENNGGFYDQNPVSKSPSSALFPLKEKGPLSNTAKYGGYNKPSISYFIVVESLDKKNNKIVTIESMPVVYAKKYEKDEQFAKSLLTDFFKLKEPKILVKKLLIRSPIKINNTVCRITGKNGSGYVIAHNVQWNVDQESKNYLHLLEKYKDRETKNKTYSPKNPLPLELNELEINNLKNGVNQKIKRQFITKEKNRNIYLLIKKQLEKDIYNGISFDSPRATIESGFEKFNKLDIKSQVIVLFEMLHLLKCNRVGSDLSLISGKSNTGNLTLSKKLQNNKRYQFINQSVTGVYENVLFSYGKVK